MTALRKGTEARFPDCPRQYANSCLSKAEDEAKAAAIARIAGRVSYVGGCKEAWCFRVKRARKRIASGVVSFVRAARRGNIVSSGQCFEGSEDVGCAVDNGCRFGNGNACALKAGSTAVGAIVRGCSPTW